MKRFSKLYSLILAILMLSSMISCCVYAEGARDLTGSIWVLNTWQDPEGHVQITVTDRAAAEQWIGFYQEIIFMSANRYRLETIEHGQHAFEVGNYRMNEKGLILQPDAEEERICEKSDTSILLQQDRGITGFAMSGHQSLSPENPQKEAMPSKVPEIPEPRLETSSLSTDLYGTHWVGTDFETMFSDMKVIKDGNLSLTVDQVLSLAKLVPSEQFLEYYPGAVYIYLDFHADSSFEIGMQTAILGTVDENQPNFVTGTWGFIDNVLNLRVDGNDFPLRYENGKITLSYAGFGISFTRH